MDELVVGTYEGFLLGYSLQTLDNVKVFKQTFATHSHTASVRCISVAGKFLASGGTDDKVVVIDLKLRKEHTVLMNHSGTINAVAFTHNGTHLITGSDDGCIIVTRTGNWQMEKVWKKAHGGQPVTAIAVHPTDKLALSIGADKTLRTWNLIKGRPAFTINLASKLKSLPTDLIFSPGGDRFALLAQQSVDIWTISKAGVEKQITCNSKPTSVQWVSDDRLFIGLESGNIITLTVNEMKALTYNAYKQRVKCLYYENNVLYSASSAGVLKVWRVTDSKLDEICSHNANCRITCVTLNRQNHLIKKEDVSDHTDNEEEKQITSDENENSDLDISDKMSMPVKRKPGAFVAISYEDNEEENKKKSSSTKKPKKRKKNKKNQDQ